MLDGSVASGHILVPTSAVRDEGTSYHYLPAEREVALDESGVDTIVRTLEKSELKYTKCKTWTTDAFYRETPGKVTRRVSEGCLCVEMECSALAAVAEFRGARFAQLLYGGDSVDGGKYDDRRWWENASARERLFRLSLDACVSWK